MMRHGITALLMLAVAIAATAQPKENYYTGGALDGKKGRELELALSAIVYPHTKVAYDNLWTKYETTDVLPEELLVNPQWTDQVYDMYASWTEFPKYYSAHNGETKDQLHSQTGGFNREHAVANSWWGGNGSGAMGEAYTDLHHLTPADGAANAAKSDYPLGEYRTGMDMTLGWPTQTKTAAMGNNTNYTYVRADNTTDHSGSWSHVWNIAAGEYGGGATKVWEPADEYKGDFARMYMYVVCAYEGRLTWQTKYMFENENGSAGAYTTIKPWARDLLLQWHRQDRVSDKERARNNAVEGIQSNRNPFIDYPELAEYIWGDKADEGFSLSNALLAYDEAYINPPEPVAKTAPQLFFPYVIRVGQTFAGATLNTDSRGTLTFTTGNPAVATVHPATGRVTAVAPGTAIITVTQAEDDTHAAGQASYMVEVLPAE